MVPVARLDSATQAVQFDHRVLGYAIWLLALFHPFNVARVAKVGPLLTGAAFLAMAVTVQAALGIWTLVAVVPLPLAMMHQAMAMVTLTFAVIHAARVTVRDPMPLRMLAPAP
ncbi:MAG TPA: COX15/CtaA family protein [Xanthobacteraceae bacterium]|nr:COX15/CtaA family protein [Xanthobacteraceae bacterium]